MTQDEMDNDQLQAGAMLLATRLTVDRSRHESVTETALWFMDGKSQRGSATRIDGGWRVNRMFNGSPTSERLEAYLGGAVEHILTQDPQRFRKSWSEAGDAVLREQATTQTRSDSRFRVVKIVGRVTMLALVAIGTAKAEPAHKLDTNALCRNILHMIPAHRRLEVALGSEIVATCQPDMPASNKLLVYFDGKDMDELVWWETHNEVRVVILGSPDKE